MKTPRFLLIGVPVLIVILALSYILTRPHFRHWEEQRRVDRTIASTNATVSPASVPAGAGRARAIFDQLGLSDAQRMQIARIRETTTDRQQRRAAILDVLTPEQRAKFQQLRATSPAATP